MASVQHWRHTLRALPTVFKVSFAQAVAYRAEMLVWVLATTMPLIMLALWQAVAQGGPVGRLGPNEFTAYFLSTFIVRQLTGSWVAWELNYQVRNGSLAVKLLRPFSPILQYAAENLAMLPLRIVVSLPIAAIMLALLGAQFLPRSALIWGIWCLALLGSWLITFTANLIIGTLSLYLESSIKVMDVWLAAFFVFSGYLIPIETFPPAFRQVVDWLPFRYQIGFPVELMTSAHSVATAWSFLLRQWLWVGVLVVVSWGMWKRGVRRFAAYGG